MVFIFDRHRFVSGVEPGVTGVEVGSRSIVPASGLGVAPFFVWPVSSESQGSVNARRGGKSGGRGEARSATGRDGVHQASISLRLDRAMIFTPFLPSLFIPQTPPEALALRPRPAASSRLPLGPRRSYTTPQPPYLATLTHAKPRPHRPPPRMSRYTWTEPPATYDSSLSLFPSPSASLYPSIRPSILSSISLSLKRGCSAVRDHHRRRSVRMSLSRSRPG